MQISSDMLREAAARAQAEVRAAAERQVRVGIARHVETLGRIELV